MSSTFFSKKKKDNSDEKPTDSAEGASAPSSESGNMPQPSPESVVDDEVQKPVAPPPMNAKKPDEPEQPLVTMPEDKYKEHGSIAFQRSALNSKGIDGGPIGVIGLLLGCYIAYIALILKEPLLTCLFASIGIIVFKNGLYSLHSFIDTFKVLFTSKHISEASQNLLEALLELRSHAAALSEKDGYIRLASHNLGQGSSTLGSLRETLIASIRRIQNGSSEPSSLSIVKAKMAHRMRLAYTDTSEQYAHGIRTYDSVAALLPLIGLACTLVELIGFFSSFTANIDPKEMLGTIAAAMKFTLYGAIASVAAKLVAHRFKSCSSALDCDFEELYNSIEVILDHYDLVTVSDANP